MFEDLFKEEEVLQPPPEYTNTSRRPFLVLVAILGGILLVTLVCLAIYAVILVPRGRSVNATQTAQAALQSTIVTELAQLPETMTLPPPTPSPIPSPTTTSAPTATITPPPSETPPPEASPTPVPTDEPTQTTQPTLVSPAELETLLLDGFAAGSGWPVAGGENFNISYASGGYRMQVNIVFADIWSVRDWNLEDAIIEVDARKTSGPDNGYFGVICRFQDSANFYAFTIDNQGNYRIFKKQGGEMIDLGTPGQSDEIRIGEDNRIRGSCIGESLVLEVNGQELLRGEDETIVQGTVGLLAGTLDANGLEVVFDNFLLSQPK